MTDNDNPVPEVPIDEQVEALIRRELRSLREKYAPQLSQDDAYRTLLTFTRADVVQYLKTNYNITDLLKTSPGPDDGFYFVRTLEGLKVWYQERGIRMLEAAIRREEDAWSHYAKFLLKTSGTGLQFK